MTLNFSVLAFVEFVAYLMIAGFFIRWTAARFSDRPFGKALAYIY